MIKNKKDIRPLIHLNDLDGVHFWAPSPVKTALKLFKRNVQLPQSDQTIKELGSSYGFKKIIDYGSFLFHILRPVKKDTLKGLAEFQKASKEHKRKIIFEVVSGRKRNFYSMTLEKLNRSGHMKYFSSLNLDKGNDALAWKDYRVNQALKDGFNVVQIDDDLLVGLLTSRRVKNYEKKGAKVVVYIIRHFLNSGWLIRRSGIIMPENVVFVNNFSDAVRDFEQRLGDSRI